VTEGPAASATLPTVTDVQIEMPPDRVAELARSGDAQLVDVRTAEEHEAGHVPGARHLPLERLSEQASSLDRDRPVVFFCRSGDRSAMAAEAFRGAGYDATSMEGGLEAWAAAGLPLEPEGGVVLDRGGLPPRL
jgi:rhodanese-related sulfurtransferase